MGIWSKWWTNKTRAKQATEGKDTPQGVFLFVRKADKMQNMPHLDLFAERKHSTIDIGGKVWKIPNEYTVEEFERLLELREEIEALGKEKIDAQDTENEKVKRLVSLAFTQLQVILGHYQPDTNIEDLRKLLTQNEVFKIIGFFDKYRHEALVRLLKERDGSKKKSSSKQLREFRRTMTFMISRGGFSLLEVRKLYVDEFSMFYQELIYCLEEAGELKKGNYDKLMASVRPETRNIADVMREQFRKIMGGRK